MNPKKTPAKVSDTDIRYVIQLSHARAELFSETLVRAHVAHLKRLESNGQLELAGPFTDAAGGMLILRVSSEDQARMIAEADPFVSSGAESYELRRWELSHRGNNHQGMG
ncbi:MAG: hypothetical protein GXP55_07245 [Deltaproteobacteria bacterium]|nr:hypothetical protein [Deltaproteobacteria bacterium]